MSSNRRPSPRPHHDVPFLAAGGEMGALMRAHDWSSSPLGSPADWPQALRTAVRLLPGMPVLIISGFAEAEGIAPELPRLTKPFRQAELAASIASLWSAKAPRSLVESDA